MYGQGISKFFTGLVYHGKSAASALTITAGVFVGVSLTGFALLRTPHLLPQEAEYSPCVGNEYPKYRMVVLHAAQYPAWTELSDDDFEIDLEPLVCDHVVFHGATAEYIKNHTKLIKHQIEWAENFPKDCLLSLGPTCRPPARIFGAKGEAYTKKWEVKLYASQYLQDLIQRKRIVSSINGTVPWALFTDVDFIFANKEKGLESVISRLQSGFSHGQNATRPYYTSEDTLFNSVMKAERTLPADPPKFDSMAFAMATDQGGRRFIYNSGGYIYKPSTVASFIFDTVLYLFNHTAFTHDRDFIGAGDQGMFSVLLRDGFDFVTEFHHRLVHAVKRELLEPSCQGTELMAVHRINLTKLFTNPVLYEVAWKWFPRGKVPVGEPDSVALVCSRWFNSPACEWAFRERVTSSQQFECDDFAAHLNGCDKDYYQSKPFRDLFKGKDNCKESFSFKTNEDGSPFSWDQWTKDVGAIAVH